MSNASPPDNEPAAVDSWDAVPTRNASKDRFWEVYPIGIFIAVLLTLLWAGFLVSLTITLIAALIGAP
jgi:hypothetical protein